MEKLIYGDIYTIANIWSIFLMLWVRKTPLFYSLRISDRIMIREHVAFENGFRCKTAFQERPFLGDKFCLWVPAPVEAVMGSSMPHSCLCPCFSCAPCAPVSAPHWPVPPGPSLCKVFCGPSQARELCVSAGGTCKGWQKAVFYVLKSNAFAADTESVQ